MRGGGIIKEHTICTISLEGFHKKYLQLIRQQYTTETFITSLLANAFQWDEILKAYKNHKRENLQKDFQRYEAIKKQCRDLNVFAKLFRYGTQNSALIYYPGIALPINLNAADKNFSFRHPVDFKGLQQREKQILAFFGPSTVEECYIIEDSDTFVFKVQALQSTHRNPKIVLNFGRSGFTLYEQFLLYASLVYPLKPEIVVAVFFGVDIFAARLGCEVLLEQHKIFYNGGYLEKDYRDIIQSVAPMRYQFLQAGEKTALNADAEILEALQLRLAQFSAMVTSYGGKFYPILCPLLACKKQWTEEEEKKYCATSKDFRNISYDENRQRERNLMEAFKAMPRDFMLYDGNDATRDSTETLFLDFIHLTPKGNDKLAEYIVNLVC